MLPTQFQRICPLPLGLANVVDGETGPTVQRLHNGYSVGEIKELAKRELAKREAPVRAQSLCGPWAGQVAAKSESNGHYFHRVFVYAIARLCNCLARLFAT